MTKSAELINIESLTKEELISTVLDLYDTLEFERAQYRYYIKYLVNKFYKNTNVDTQPRVLH
jgi:hypothetical protein